MKGTFCFKFFFIFPLLSLVVGCGYIPKNGDLVFQVAGDTPFSVAITDATSWGEDINFAHVAIVAVEKSGRPYIIEASPQYGVCITEWNEFIESSPKVGGRPGVVIKRVVEKFPDEEVIKRALSYIGEGYDWSYYPDNHRMYCSELVYESYLDKEGNHIFHSKPMTFRDKDGALPEFWNILFKKLGLPIPEGMLGTNPNDLSKESILKEVHRFF